MKKNIVSLILLLVALSASAQQFVVNSSIDSTLLLVGEQAKLTFSVAQSADMKVAAPMFSDTIVSGLEIVERLPLDTQKQDDGSLVVNHEYLITAFDSALFFIEPVAFVCNSDTQYSQAMSLKVMSVPVDTAAHAICDIKPTYAPPFDWPLFWRIVLIVLGAAIVAVGGYFGYRYWEKRQNATNDTVHEPIDLRPAHVIALEKLDAIKNEKIWQQNRTIEYYTQLTDVVREYIDRRYSISAAEQTSSEILADIQPVLRDNKDIFAELKQMLQLADLVKFAKYKTIVGEDEKTLSRAYAFVNATKLEETAEAVPTQEPLKKTDAI